MRLKTRPRRSHGFSCASASWLVDHGLEYKKEPAHVAVTGCAARAAGALEVPGKKLEARVTAALEQERDGGADTAEGPEAGASRSTHALSQM